MLILEPNCANRFSFETTLALACWSRRNAASNLFVTAFPGCPCPESRHDLSDRFSIARVNRGRVHRNWLGSSRLAGIGPLSLWTMRGNPTGRCSGPGRCAPVALDSWLANNPPFHTHRTSTDPECTQREDELLLSTFHSSECESQRQLQTAPAGLGHQEYVLQLSSKRTQEEQPVATETAKDNSSPVIRLWNPEGHRFAHEVTNKDSRYWIVFPTFQEASQHTAQSKREYAAMLLSMMLLQPSA